MKALTNTMKKAIAAAVVAAVLGCGLGVAVGSGAGAANERARQTAVDAYGRNADLEASQNYRGISLAVLDSETLTCSQAVAVKKANDRLREANDERHDAVGSGDIAAAFDLIDVRYMSLRVEAGRLVAAQERGECVLPF